MNTWRLLRNLITQTQRELIQYETALSAHDSHIVKWTIYHLVGTETLCSHLTFQIPPVKLTNFLDWFALADIFLWANNRSVVVFSPHNHQRLVWRAQWCFSHSPAENNFTHWNSPQKDYFLCYLKALRRRRCEPTWLAANSPMCARQNRPGTRRGSPGRHVCGKGDAVGDEGQRRGAGDVLPLRRRHPSCMETPGIRWAHFLFKWFV